MYERPVARWNAEHNTEKDEANNELTASHSATITQPSSVAHSGVVCAAMGAFCDGGIFEKKMLDGLGPN